MSLAGLRRQSRRARSTQWIDSYAQMIQISLLGFLVSGAFLGLANFDLFYQLVAMVILLKMLYHADAPATALVPVEESQPIEMSEETLVTHEA